MSLNRFITEETIIFIEDNSDKAAVIHALVERAVSLGKLTHQAAFEAAVIKRENMISTGLGLGVAVPHAPSDGTDDFFIMTGIARTPIEWQAIDSRPVNIVFLVGIPGSMYGKSDQTRVYLQIISQLMLLIKNENRRHLLQTAADARQAIEVMTETNQVAKQ